MRASVVGESKPFLHHVEAFDPETLETIGRAYDLAIATLHDRGQPESVRSLIADRIMLAARRGERDIHALCRGALRGIALPL